MRGIAFSFFLARMPDHGLFACHDHQGLRNLHVHLAGTGGVSKPSSYALRNSEETLCKLFCAIQYHEVSRCQSTLTGRDAAEWCLMSHEAEPCCWMLCNHHLVLGCYMRLSSVLGCFQSQGITPASLVESSLSCVSLACTWSFAA